MMVIASLVLATKLMSASRVTVTEHVPAVSAVSVELEMEHTVLPLATAKLTAPVPLPAEPRSVDNVAVAGEGFGL